MWGWHLILNVSGCDKKAITNKITLEHWIKTLVHTIEMVPYGEPQIVHFGKNEDHLAGWTVIQLIETSNIMAHFCDNTGEAYIDVFSCKEFDPEMVINHFTVIFNPTKIDKIRIIRKAPQ